MSTIAMDAVTVRAGVRAQSRPRPAARAVPAASARPRTRLRITARGRAVLLALVAIPFVIALLVAALNGGGATATLDAGAPLQVVTVQPGQSLWALAESIAPGADPRDVIEELVALNGLESADVWAGQQLAIPAQYASGQ